MDDHTQLSQPCPLANLQVQQVELDVSQADRFPVDKKWPDFIKIHYPCLMQVKLPADQASEWQRSIRAWVTLEEMGGYQRSVRSLIPLLCIETHVLAEIWASHHG